jgi:hypothetical protein
VERGAGGGAAVENGQRGSSCSGCSTSGDANGEARVRQRTEREKIGTRTVDLSGRKMGGQRQDLEKYRVP